MQSCITRKLKPVVFVYHMAGSQREVVPAEKDLGVYITDNLTWNKQVNVQGAKASGLLGYVRRNTRLIKSIIVSHPAYLIPLGYATLACVQTSPLRGGTSVHRLCYASLDSAVNKPDSKARACPKARYKVYPGSTIHL